MSKIAEQLSLTDIPAPPQYAPLPEQEISGEVLIEKYAKGKETNVHDVRRRVAYALAQVEQEADRAHWEGKFLWAQENGFIPAGRIHAAAGTDLQHVLRCGVFLLDMTEFKAMNAVYERMFGDHRPARTTIQAAALPSDGLRVEIDCIAYLP